MSSEKTSCLNNYAQRSRQLRLFISSTFVDMNAERNALIRIFPKISELCNEREVEFFPLDLRWGITENATKEGRVVETCLREIDDSRPFFIGILGGRYGWTPNDSDLGYFSHELKKIYPWIEDAVKNGMSITEMEIQHAVLMRKNVDYMNAAFYIRSDNMLVDNSFKETPGSKDAIKLSNLKTAIRSQDRFKVREYDSVTDLAEKVLKDVTEFINSTYPVRDVTAYDLIADWQERIFRSRLHSLIPMKGYQEQIDAWIKEKKKKNLLITGCEGRGKSFLLVSIVQQLREQESKVVYVDISEQSGKISALEYVSSELLHLLGVQSRKRNKDEEKYRTFIVGVKSVFSFLLARLLFPFQMAFGNQDKVENRIENILKNSMNDIEAINSIVNVKKLSKALRNTPDTILYVALDNLSNMSPETMSLLRALEGILQIRMICSATLNSKAHLYLQDTNGVDILQVENLDVNQATTFINDYLAQFGKSLDCNGEQCNKLLQSGIAGNARLLSHVLELLVRFGSYEQLDNYITELSTIEDEKSLYELMFNHILAQFRSDSDYELVQRIVTAFAVVKEGLSESEIQNIFTPKAMEWALLRPYLFSVCRHKGRFWKPYSQLCRSAIFQLMQEQTIIQVVNMIIHYYENTLHCWGEHLRMADQGEHIDAGKYIREMVTLERQVQILPMLYYEFGMSQQLYNWAVYIQADMRFKDDERICFWKKLYEAGYSMENSMEVDVPPYVRENFINTNSATDNNLSLFLELYDKYEWHIATSRERQALYRRWHVVASTLNHSEDLNWLSSKII